MKKSQQKVRFKPSCSGFSFHQQPKIAANVKGVSKTFVCQFQA